MEVRKRFENDKLKKLQIFNGAQLKYIAFVSMLIDHVNNALITPFLNGKGFLLHLSNLFSNRFLTYMIPPILILWTTIKVLVSVSKKQKYALFSYYFSLLDSKQTASTWPVEGNISTG